MNNHRPARPASADRFDIVLVGDLLLADAAQRQLDRHGYHWPFEFLRPLLRADYLIGNAEGPITDRTEKHFPDQRWSYHADPTTAAALADLGFDAMSLSNNHACDRGTDGIADSIRHLRKAGVTPFGAGMNVDEAETPLLISSPFGVTAVVGTGQRWKHGQIAGPSTAGTIPMNAKTIVRQRKLATAAGARWVLAFPHWGKNYAPVTDQQRANAAAFAAAGYDLVIGTGAHVPQPVEIIDGMPVVYSLGNSVFGSRGRFTDKTPGHGLIARAVFTKDGPTRIELSCITTDNRQAQFQPRPCAPHTARQVIDGLGPHVTWADGIGICQLGIHHK